MWCKNRENDKNFLPPTNASWRSADQLVCFFDILGFNHDRNVTFFSRSKNHKLLLVLTDFLENARVSCEDTRNNLHFVTDLEGKLIGVNLNVEHFDFSIGKGRRLGSGAYKSGDTGNVSYHVPAFVRHCHFNKKVAGEEIGLHNLFFALVIDLHVCFNGDLDVID